MIDINKIRLHDKLRTDDGFIGCVQGLTREKGERKTVLLSFVLDRPHPPEFEIRGGVWYLVSYPADRLELC